MKIRIATRKSKLARKQTDLVIEKLKENNPDIEFEKHLVVTKGDKILNISLNKIGGKGLFTKEIEMSLFDKRAQAAVHSMKDIPYEMNELFELAAILLRDDVRDVLISKDNIKLIDMPQGAIIGTSSKRRAAQVNLMRPDIKVVPIRGNVQTRIEKMHKENMDGIILAAAGIKRINLDSIITEYFDPKEFVPAVGQGALGVEILKDSEYSNLFKSLNDNDVRMCVEAERSFMEELDGGCHSALGAYAKLENEEIKMVGIFEIDGILIKKFISGPKSQYIEIGKNLARKILNTNKNSGKVYLIGAGPGDEDLITLKALMALKECTVVMYDRLINPNLLNHLNEDCQIIYCGKRPGHHSKNQDEINEMLIDFVKKGHTVGRIKGGDPFVFGRGGEEALELVEKGVEFEVIPGITSPIAVLNYAGIPITHRRMAQSFHVYTGTSADKLNIDWEGAAKNKGTSVFLMGLSNIDMIMNNLINNGKNKNTPCAVIMKGTTSEQKIVTGIIDNISSKVKEEKLKPPCIIVVGEVVNFSKELNWWEKKPLSGMNVCVTRSKMQAKEFSYKLKKLGADVTEINSIDFEDQTMNLAEYIQKLAEYDFIVLTSVNGVNYFFDYLKKIDYDIRQIKAKFAVVGPATEEALTDRGVIPEITCDEFCGKDLSLNLKKEVKDCHKVLVPRSKSGKEELVDSLKSIGCLVDEVYTYDVIIGKLKDYNTFDDCNVVTFTSPSTVKNMIKLVCKRKIRKKYCVAIGPITAGELEKQGIDCIIADQYCIDGIIEKLKEVKNDL